MNRRVFWIAAGAIVVLALGLRVFHAAERDSLWGDEAQELGILRSSATVGELLDIVRQDGHPPLHYLIEWGLYRTSGESVVLQRPHLVTYGTLAVVLVMLLAYRCFGARCALLTGLLAAASPYLVAYSTELRNYSLLAAMGPLFGIAYVRLLQRRDVRSAALWGVAAALLSLTHYYGLFVVATSGVFVLAQTRSRAGLLHVAAGAGAFLIVFAPWMPSFLWQTSVDLQAWARPRTDPRILLRILTYPLGTPLAIAAGMSLLLGVAHVLRPERPAQERTAFGGLVFASVGAAVFAYIVQLSRGSFASRYMIAYTLLLLPAACLYASRIGTLGDVPVWRGLNSGHVYRLPQKWHARIGVVLLALVALGYHAEWKRWGSTRVTAVAHCVELIREAEQPGDLIIVSPAWTMLSAAYHYSGPTPMCSPPYGEPVPWMEHLHRVERSQDAHIVRTQVEVIADHLRQGGRVWFVVRRDQPVDPDSLEQFPSLAPHPSRLRRHENTIHYEIATALYREGLVSFRWESDHDAYRYNAVLLRFDPRPRDE